MSPSDLRRQRLAIGLVVAVLLDAALLSMAVTQGFSASKTVTITLIPLSIAALLVFTSDWRWRRKHDFR